MDFEQIRYDRRGAVAVITLHRPEQRNTVTYRMLDELTEAFTRADADAREGVTAFQQKRPPQFSSRVGRDMPAFFPWWTGPGFWREAAE